MHFVADDFLFVFHNNNNNQINNHPLCLAYLQSTRIIGYLIGMEMTTISEGVFDRE